VTANSNAPLPGIPPSSIGTKVPEQPGPGAPGGTAAAPRRYGGVELWLHRITVLLFVFVCAAAGVLLIILPWSPQWTDNRLLLGNPTLQMAVGNGFVRGLVSGLGVLDIWIGFWEAVHYREYRRI
jgi:hypothetical protein